MRELIDDVLATLNSQFKRTQIKIEVNCAKEISLHGVPGLLEQLFTNLLINSLNHAFDHSQLPGAIDINVSQSEGNIDLRYADNGAGMSAEVVAQAFEPLSLIHIWFHLPVRVLSTHFPGSVSGMRATRRHSPWLRPFPPRPPQSFHPYSPGFSPCSVASSVLRAHPTSRRRR